MSVSPDRFIAYVALDNLNPLDPNAIINQMKGYASMQNVRLEATDANDNGRKADGCIILFSGSPILVMPVNEPIPQDVFKDDLAQNYWPEWKNAAQAQKAHYIVATLGSFAGHEQARAAAIMVLSVCAALSRLSQARGIYWVSAEFFSPLQPIIEVMEKGKPFELPLFHIIKTAWVPDGLDKQGQPLPAAVTQGLSPFIGREIFHTGHDDALIEIVNRLLNLSAYLIDNGPILNDGDTVGTTEQERIVVRHGTYGNQAVYRLEFIS